MYVKVVPASGRATCKLCKKRIKKDEQQLVITWSITAATAMRLHLLCMKKVCDKEYKGPKMPKLKKKSREENLIFE